METKNKDSENKRIWTYAIILFTGAFVVLLVTAFSQIKLNSNISEYKKEYNIKLSSVKKKNETNLNIALEENKALMKKIDQMKKELDKKNKDIEKYKSNPTKVQSAVLKSKQAYETLLEAENLYKSNQVIESAKLLQSKCSSQLLDPNGLERYQSLVSKTYYKAALKLYYEGYKDYKSLKYDEAISNFQTAAMLQPEEYFSDDCYFFIAYSQYKKGDKKGLAKTIDILSKNYPQSDYINEVSRLLTE